MTIPLLERLSHLESHAVENEWERTAETVRDAAGEIERLRASLAEVREWISNWSPNFTQDEEWPETKARMDAALARTEAK